MKMKSFSFRFGCELLNSPLFLRQKKDIFDAVQATEPTRIFPPVRCIRQGRKMLLSGYAEGTLAGLEGEFGSRGWRVVLRNIEDKRGEIGCGFRNRRVQVEAQFSTTSYWHKSLFAIETSYSQGIIDVGAIILPTARYAKTIEYSVANFENARQELSLAKLGIPVPISLIGIEPWKINPWAI